MTFAPAEIIVNRTNMILISGVGFAAIFGVGAGQGLGAAVNAHLGYMARSITGSVGGGLVAMIVLLSVKPIGLVETASICVPIGLFGGATLTYIFARLVES